MTAFEQARAFLDTHPTVADIDRDLDSLPENVAQALYTILVVHEVLSDLERDGYIQALPPKGDWEE